MHPRVLERAVATATLTSASDEGEAATALAAIPDLADAGQQTLRDLAWWLRDLYPSRHLQPTAARTEDQSWFRPLTPNLLGEALVARVLESVPELANRLLASASQAQGELALTVLTQASLKVAGGRAGRASAGSAAPARPPRASAARRAAPLSLTRPGAGASSSATSSCSARTPDHAGATAEHLNLEPNARLWRHLTRSATSREEPQGAAGWVGHQLGVLADDRGLVPLNGLSWGCIRAFLSGHGFAR
jgi:hypothetical protein